MHTDAMTLPDPRKGALTVENDRRVIEVLTLIAHVRGKSGCRGHFGVIWSLSMVFPVLKCSVSIFLKVRSMINGSRGLARLRQTLG